LPTSLASRGSTSIAAADEAQTVEQTRARTTENRHGVMRRMRQADRAHNLGSLARLG